MKTAKIVALSVISTLAVQFVFAHFWLALLLGWFGTGLLGVAMLKFLSRKLQDPAIHDRAPSFAVIILGPIGLLATLFVEWDNITTYCTKRFSGKVSFRSPIYVEKE